MRIKTLSVDYFELEETLNNIGEKNIIQVLPVYNSFKNVFVIIFKEMKSDNRN